MSDIPLSTLYHRGLTAAAKAVNLPTIQDETQELLQAALSDLRLVQSRVASLSLFSQNELLSDIPSRDLVYLLLPFILAEIHGRVRTTDTEERMDQVMRAQSSLRIFLTTLDKLEVVPESEKTLYAQKTSTMNDPAKRRELKIKQYQKEKEIRSRIQAVRKRRYQGRIPNEPTSDFELIASLLPDPSKAASASEDDPDTEDVLRQATLLLLRLTYAEAHAQSESLDQELQLLRSAPPPRPVELASDYSRRRKEPQSDDMWRLDAPIPSGGPDGKGPLLDSSGKPLRPFTILPASSDRARLQAEVFRPDHRLPTMSVDEYLEVERQRGYIITGGGPQSEAAPTSSEQLALDAEMEGTVFAEQKAEEKRQKDEAWARYTDTHPRGAGNTMNRG
ncbi:serine/threonine protein phosphatase PP2A-associated protein [Sparassis latifolia]|uniref:TAP42-like protein n=1 Tax=Sparassis crispa TaxID=139825 RepID=A0A401GIB3_9APHY|nr:TAP42-like protein [Sparassis crispa]GBE81898.1 TAP42-like protein [Sparassis crispa]